jgi:hypothetical protein
VKNLSDHFDLPCELLTSSMCYKYSNLVGWLDWLYMPCRPIPCVSYTCSYFQFQTTYLHPSLPYNFLQRHVGLISIFLQDPLWGCAYIHGAMQLVVCLFYQCSFSHIHRKWCRCIVPSVVDSFSVLKMILELHNSKNRDTVKYAPEYHGTHNQEWLRSWWPVAIYHTGWMTVQWLRLAPSNRPNSSCLPPPQLRMETHPVSGMLCS